MSRLFRNLYFLVFIAIIVFISGLSLQYFSASRSASEGSLRIAKLAVNTLIHELEGHLTARAAAIEGAARFIALEQASDEEILTYLEKLLADEPSFFSIYYGDRDNRMINASGWQPYPGFDLRKRPWYSAAATTGRTIYTEAFVNASEDMIIVTVASPVFNASGEMLGVVGGDLPMTGIIDLVQAEGRDTSLSFLVDGQGQILAHPAIAYDPGAPLVALEEKYPSLANYMFEEEEKITDIALGEQEGFLASLAVDHTDWFLASFVDSESLLPAQNRVTHEYIIFLVTTFLLFTLVILYHDRSLHRPLVRFEEGLGRVNPEEDRSYRLPPPESRQFISLVSSVNKLLDRTEGYFNRLEEQEQALREKNQELKKTIHMLTSAEEALDYSEEKLFFLSYHDQLTGLNNRAFFEAKLRRLDGGTDYPLTIVTADINGLKLINETFGHEAGNLLLKACATVLEESLCERGILARIGGDEFAVILPLADELEGERFIRQVRFNLNRYNNVNQKVPLDLSLGLATALEPETPLRSVLKEAEDNLYRDKLLHSESASNSLVRSLLAALAERDYLSEGHSRRLEKNCVTLGEKVGLSSPRLSDLALLAQVHDLGKVGIPDRILFKEGPLDSGEWEEMKDHPEKGFRIASVSSELSVVAELILKHHEHWDGGGYPLGLHGEEIPMECRILAIADAFDAMTNDRPYRKAISPEAALAEIERCAGTQFDPHLAQLFKEILLSRAAGNNSIPGADKNSEKKPGGQ